ncbi:hypothetical protein BCR37DRAFT_382220 [Protomyces lactucae-debilis]|uniref:Heparan-alpha-glucosaminide N-acetyltransferase catalytic domain-containing protein n=1 Tax=Protomyces lactucae-debilis TaxID=2754530 RepID=A0A1Y2F3Y3_PROLT|nr:uncharacterized protein BCR37DRAFT_382220 [Protomyces lactucae-debilis]ORY78572.1 hypothetical protein BCR37DRAFT_382220 [Protomyces lactucae-debilis]
MASERTRLLSEPTRGIEPESLVPPGKQPEHARPGRILAFDLTRGLICLLMAIDHTFFISGKEHPTESYEVHPDRTHLYLSSWYHYGLRFVTHTCAPGFSLLMGLGLVYFVEARIKKAQWTLAKTFRNIVIRGLLFLLVGFVATLPWARAMKVWVLIDIIATLGIDFIICGGLVILFAGIEQRVQKRWVSHALTFSLLVLAVLGACTTIWVAPAPGQKASSAVKILWMTGPSDNGYLLSRFPPLSWLPLVLYGAFFARVSKLLPARRTASFSFILAMAMLLLFLAVRVPGSWGNLTPVKPSWFRKGVREFLWTDKYPPDLPYITLFSAIIHLFITSFSLLPGDFPGQVTVAGRTIAGTNQVLLDIGTSPFVFYFVHMYSLKLMGVVLQALNLTKTPEELGPGYTGPGIGNGWGFWALYLVLVAWMWFVCRWYGRFKASKSVDSPWRYF